MRDLESEGIIENRRISVRADERLIRRMERLVAEPGLGFTSLEHFCAAALHSFVSFKERQLGRLRADAEGLR